MTQTNTVENPTVKKHYLNQIIPDKIQRMIVLAGLLTYFIRNAAFPMKSVAQSDYEHK